jgi:hypothetical protein
MAAAILFGAGTPLAKQLKEIGPWLLAGILYLGSGIGLAIWRRIRSSVPVRLSRSDVGCLAAAVFFGGGVGPVLLMAGWLMPKPPPPRCYSMQKAY